MRGQDACDPTHKRKCPTVSTVIFPLHPQSPVKHRTSAFTEESWPVFRGLCARRTRRKPSRTRSEPTKAWSAQKTHGSPAFLQCILHLAMLPLEARYPDITVFPREKLYFDITRPHENLPFCPCRAHELKNPASRYAILIILLFGRGPRCTATFKTLRFLTYPNIENPGLRVEGLRSGLGLRV